MAEHIFDDGERHIDGSCRRASGDQVAVRHDVLIVISSAEIFVRLSNAIVPTASSSSNPLSIMHKIFIVFTSNSSITAFPSIASQEEKAFLAGLCYTENHEEGYP